MKEFDAAGIKIVQPARHVPRLFKLDFLEDLWGAKVEVLQDPETLGFHHVHLRAPGQDAAFQRYLENFGGERAKFPAKKGDVTTTEGHTIDHIGFRTAMDLTAKANELKAKGAKFTTDPQPFRNLHISYTEGPAKVKIQLLQR
jgi:4-hydroxyphenylpyruvate dioxygenase-like putative hemolysin